jgi:hypothetical protein
MAVKQPILHSWGSVNTLSRGKGSSHDLVIGSIYFFML